MPFINIFRMSELKGVMFTLTGALEIWSPVSTWPFSLGLSSTAGTLVGAPPILNCCN